MDKKIVFYDTEYTTWEGAMERQWSAPGEEVELVQIGAIRFNLDTLKEEEEFNITVKTAINPQLSAFFTKLTGITQKAMDKNGIKFPKAYQKFLTFLKKDTASSYGTDHTIINRNLKLNNMKQGFTGHNIRPWFLEHGASYGINKNINSGKLAETLSITFNTIQEHNALHDVRSICAAYRFLIQNGAPQPRF